MIYACQTAYALRTHRPVQKLDQAVMSATASPSGGALLEAVVGRVAFVVGSATA